MQDIETRVDIDELMKSFYQTAVADGQIGFIFSDVAKLDLDKHLPVIGDFWDSLLLGRNVYLRHGRNPLEIHAELNKLTPLTARHFGRWLELFGTAVDSNFSGPRADFIKLRGQAIANRMIGFIGVREPEATNRGNLPNPSDQ